MLLSDYEAWPLAMAEAMMLGRPAVATRTSGACTHIVDGQNGLLCDFSAESAADALQRCAEDENLMRTIRCGAARVRSRARSAAGVSRIYRALHEIQF